MPTPPVSMQRCAISRMRLGAAQPGMDFHTYSTYARGLGLDVAPKGRDEGLPFPIAWVRRRIAHES